MLYLRRTRPLGGKCIVCGSVWNNGKEIESRLYIKGTTYLKKTKRNRGLPMAFTTSERVT